MYRSLKTSKRVGSIDITPRADLRNIIKKDPPKSLMLARKLYVDDTDEIDRFIEERGNDYLYNFVTEHARGKNHFTKKQPSLYGNGEGPVSQNVFKIEKVIPIVKTYEDLTPLSRYPRIVYDYVSLKEYKTDKKVNFDNLLNVKKKLPKGIGNSSKLIVNHKKPVNHNINRNRVFNSLTTHCIKPGAMGLDLNRDVKSRKTVLRKKEFALRSNTYEPEQLWEPRNMSQVHVRATPRDNQS